MIRQMSHNKEKSGNSLVSVCIQKHAEQPEKAKARRRQMDPTVTWGSRRGDWMQQGHEWLTFLILQRLCFQ